jgi:LmbE family N-acetylglucosaminyl deacetylase
MTAIRFQSLQPKVVLGVAAHPDDLDFGASGTMATFARHGAAAYYLILTDGGKGSPDRAMTPAKLKEIRCLEQRAAGKMLGLKDVFFLDFPDGTLENTQEVKREIVRFIRKLKPDVVVTMDPSMVYIAEDGFINHPDHRAAGQATLDAVFPLARDHLSFPELLVEGLEPHKAATALLINMKEHNFVVDITEMLELKLQALAAHTSQVPDFAAAKAMVTSWAERAGAPYGHAYAEGFVRIDIR